MADGCNNCIHFLKDDYRYAGICAGDLRKIRRPQYHICKMFHAKEGPAMGKKFISIPNIPEGPKIHTHADETPWCSINLEVASQSMVNSMVTSKQVVEALGAAFGAHNPPMVPVTQEEDKETNQAPAQPEKKPRRKLVIK